MSDIELRLGDNCVIIDFEFDKEILHKVKELPQRSYNPSQKVWTIPPKETHINYFANKLKGYNIEVNFDLDDLNNIYDKEIKVNEDIIYVIFPYNERIIHKIKSLPSRRWNPDNKRWEVPIIKANVDGLIKIGENNDFFIDRKLYELKEKLKKDIEKSKAIDGEIELPTITKKLKLRPFQKAGIKYAIEKEKTFIADSVGLGKSIQSILTVEKKNAYPVLIICPAVVKLNWRKEYKKWLDKDLKITIIEGQENKSLPKSDVYICNYSVLHHNLKILKNINFNSIVIDESHYLKGFKSKRTKATKELVKNNNPQIRLLLSATPIKNRPKELIPQLEILDMLEEMGGFWKFTGRYCDRKKTQFGLDISGSSNLKELHETLRSLGYIRRKKSQVLKELPPVNRIQIPIDIDNKQEYKKAKRDIIQWIIENEGMKKAMKASYAETMVRITKLRRICAEGKLNNAIKWIKDFLVTDEKLIVFAHHKKITNTIANKFNCLKITGDTSDKDKEKAVEKFQNDENEKLIVVAIEAGSEGITLTKASNVVFLEFGWTPITHHQAEGRAYGRLNDIHGLNSYYLVAEDTIDDYILNLIEQKRKVTNEVIDGEHTKESEIKKNVVDDVINYLVKGG